jgi:hypothetical protein
MKEEEQVDRTPALEQTGVAEEAAKDPTVTVPAEEMLPDPEVVMFPGVVTLPEVRVTPVLPVIAPALVISMLVVSRAKVPLPPPMETKVLEEPVLILVVELVFRLMLVAPVRVSPPVP